MWLIDDKKTIISRDVVFNEQETCMTNMQEKTSSPEQTTSETVQYKLGVADTRANNQLDTEEGGYLGETNDENNEELDEETVSEN